MTSSRTTAFWRSSALNPAARTWDRKLAGKFQSRVRVAGPTTTSGDVVVGPHFCNNYPRLEIAGRLTCGFFDINDLKEIGGIHYCTLVAMVEGSGAANNGYLVMSLASDGTIRIEGFRKQKDYTWS